MFIRFLLLEFFLTQMSSNNASRDEKMDKINVEIVKKFNYKSV